MARNQTQRTWTGAARGRASAESPSAQAVSRRLELLAAELGHTRVRPPSEPSPSADSEDAGLDLMLGRTSGTADSWQRSEADFDGNTIVSARTRVQCDRDLESFEGVTSVKAPGRHALHRDRQRSRAGRFSERAATVLPESLRGRVALSPGALAVVAVVVALLLGVSTWRLATSQPRQQPMPTITQATPLLANSQPTAGASQAASDAVASGGASGIPPAPLGSPEGQPRVPGEVVVDVAGKVRRPGIAVLDQGARVADALKAAGGAKRGVDLTALNLARPLIDGEQILVGVAPPVGAPAVAPGVSTPTGSSLISINQADATQLETLPGVGPVTSAAIIAWRTEHGGFTAIDELLEVDGIGDATLAKLAPLVTL